MRDPRAVTPRRVLLLVLLIAGAAAVGLALSSAGIGGEGGRPAPDWLRFLVLGGCVAFLAGTLMWWTRTRD
jgi:hypothetical protein